MTTDTRWIVTQSGQYINLAHVARLFIHSYDNRVFNTYAEYPVAGTSEDYDGGRLIGNYDTETDARDALAILVNSITETVSTYTCAMPRAFRKVVTE